LFFDTDAVHGIRKKRYSLVGNDYSRLRLCKPKSKIFLTNTVRLDKKNTESHFLNMKKLILGLSFLAIAATTTFVACKKDGVKKETTGKSRNLQKASDIITNMPRLCTDGFIDSIGMKHNEMINQCFNSFDFSSVNYENEFKEEFEKYQNQYSINYNNLEVRKDTSLMMAELQNELSSEGFSFVTQLVSEARAFQDVNDFVGKINLIENQIKNQLQGREIDVLLTISSTMRHSAEYWAPQALGGNGSGFSVLCTIMDIPTTSINDISMRPTLKQVVGEALISDGISAGIGMLGLSVAMAFTAVISGPAGWVAAGIVFGESVISSAATAFLTYLRN